MKCRCCDCAHLSERAADYCGLTGLRVEAFGERECACFKKGNYENHRCVNCIFYKEECCSVIGQRVLGPDVPHSCGVFERKKKVSYPCEVSVKSFYRCRIEVDEGATDDEIKKAINDIFDDPEYHIEEDPDIEVEKQDIDVVKIDWDGVQPCDED